MNNQTKLQGDEPQFYRAQSGNARLFTRIQRIRNYPGVFRASNIKDHIQQNVGLLTWLQHAEIHYLRQLVSFSRLPPSSWVIINSDDYLLIQFLPWQKCTSVWSCGLWKKEIPKTITIDEKSGHTAASVVCIYSLMLTCTCTGYEFIRSQWRIYALST